MATATPRHLRRSLEILSLAALLVLLLTACSDNTETLPTAAGPKATPTILATPSRPTPPSTPTPTHTAEPPRMAVPPWPKHAKEPTAEGAKAAAMYYLEDLHYYMVLTGDTDPYSEVCPSELDFCSHFVNGVNALHRAGKYSFAGNMTFQDVEIRREPRPNTYTFTTSAKVEESPVYLDSGQRTSTQPAGRIGLELALTYHEGRWHIIRAVVLASDFPS